ncbi:MAG: NAD-dependent epimerase/dehydratase family protein [Candidatus Buchananbacteria bacterium]|nr:NAD-dependent epimerase/dehydratase family protein [Candidatus Buchananbacteria bacterium]
MAKKAIFDEKNVLVIGGAGMIGSHLCEALLEAAKVICVDNMVTGRRENVSRLLANPNFKFINHDITQPFDLENQQELADFRVSFQGVQEIYFLSSLVSPKTALERPVETSAVNTSGLEQALELARKYEATLVYASDPAVYGNNVASPLAESVSGTLDYTMPEAVYAQALRAGESLVANYVREYQVNAKIARIFNCYGPHWSLNNGRLIPELVRAAMAGETATVAGSETDIVAYVHVDDVIKALTKLPESNETGPVNLGSEWPIALKELVELVFATLGERTEVAYSGTSPIGFTALADISRAKESLGWFPVTRLEDGIKDTIDDLKAQYGLRAAGV